MNDHGADQQTYEPLTNDSVVRLVASNRRLSNVVGTGSLIADEIGDGNLNQVFVVRAAADPDHAVVVKQALPYLRVAGEGWPLTRERMRFETKSLLLYNELVPDLAPRVYDYSHAQSWVAMEYLGGHRIMRDAVLEGNMTVGVGADLGRFVAALTHHTSEMSLDAPTKRMNSIEFVNPELCQLQERFVYTNPFFESPENHWNPRLDQEVRSVRDDRELKLAVAAAKAQYMTCGQALLHGDLHTGSVMIRRVDTDIAGSVTNDTRVIDPEFAFYGPVGYDIGTLLANLTIGVLAHEELTVDPTERRRRQNMLFAVALDAWDTFARELDRRWASGPRGDLATSDYWGHDDDGFAEMRRNTIAAIALDAGRHGGCELLRRCMGIVAVPELAALTDLDARARVERQVIAVARSWLLDRPSRSSGTMFPTVDHLIDAVGRPLAGTPALERSR